MPTHPSTIPVISPPSNTPKRCALGLLVSGGCQAIHSHCSLGVSEGSLGEKPPSVWFQVCRSSEIFFSKAEYDMTNYCPQKQKRPCMYVRVSFSWSSKSQARLQISVKTSWQDASWVGKGVDRTRRVLGNACLPRWKCESNTHHMTDHLQTKKSINKDNSFNENWNKGKQ